jgi:lipoprotein-releasing system ATP-binding protein
MSSAYKLPEIKIAKGVQQSPQLHRSAASVVMRATGLRKSYRKGKVEIPVLNGVDFEVWEGEFQAIVGTSGSGKSTLLHLLATLDQPDDGEIFFEGNRIDNLPAKSRDILRNRYIGIVFQFYHLLPELSALENVLMPLMIRYGFTKYMLGRRKNRLRAKELLDKVGLSHRLKHRPRELSGGEMQRVAIARALIADPQLLLADEPTGNLDRQAGDEVMEILRDLNREQGLTVVMVTHDETIAAQADRTIHLVEGRVQTM